MAVLVSSTLYHDPNLCNFGQCAQDTPLHLCSARRNIVSVRVMNGFTCLIEFDRKKFDVKVVVNRVVARRERTGVTISCLQ